MQANTGFETPTQGASPDTGVGDTGTVADGIRADGADAGQSGAPGMTAQFDPDQIDLHQLPQFRKYQAETDRKMAELRRQADEAQAERERLESERIEALPPEEQVAQLKRRLNQQNRQDTRQAEGQAKLAEMQSAVADAGLQWADQRIWTDPEVVSASSGKDLPDDAAVKAVTRACLRIARADLTAARQQAQTVAQGAQAQAQVVSQRAATKALNDAGVTATSQAAPVIAPGSARDAKVEQFTRRWKAVQGQGWDTPVYRKFMADLRAAGLTVTDIGYR